MEENEYMINYTTDYVDYMVIIIKSNTSFDNINKNKDKYKKNLWLLNELFSILKNAQDG